MNARLVLFAFAVIVGAMLSTAAAQDDGPKYRVLQDRPDRLLVQLPNRMIVIAQELPTAPVVSAQVWVKTGSIYEQEFVGAGLSHYLEHLLSGGTTKNRPEAESNKILGEIGAQTNAATSLDTVRYYINTTATHTPRAIDLLSDWMQHSVLKETEFDRERDVIFREFEMGRGEPGRIFWKLTQQARYVAHPARHPTIGYIDRFKTITRDQLYTFYRRMYVPNNMVFVVVGDIDRKAVVNQIAKAWNDVPTGKLPDLSFPVEPEVEAPREMTGTASIVRPRIRLAWPGTQLGGQGDYALDLLGVVLGYGESSRLVRSVRDEAQAVTDIDAYNASFTWGKGFFGVDAEIATQPGANAATIKEKINIAKLNILAEIARIKREGVTDAELALAKRQLMADVVYEGQTAQDLAERLASDLIGMGDPDYLKRYAEKIQALTKADVAAAADFFLNNKRLITITLMPAPKDAKPSPIALPKDDDSANDLKRVPFILDNIAVLDKLRGVEAAAGAGAIQAEAPKLYTLPNGLRVILGRSNVVPAVAVQMYELGGVLGEEAGKQGLANATALMRMRGTKTRSAQQIARLLDSLGAGMDSQSGNNSVYSTAVCLKDDLPTLLELFADVTLNPSFPEDEWAKFKPRLLAALDRQTDTWDGEMSLLFRKTYYKGHPWSTPPIGVRDYIASLTVDDLRKHQADRLGASESVLAIFGDIDPDAVLKQVEQLFGQMPAKPKVAFKKPKSVKPTPTLAQRKTNKPLAAVQVGFGPGVTRKSPDFAAIQVLSRVMSSFPAGWLEQELRGKGEGLVYASWAFQFTGLDEGYFAFAFNADPAKMPKALKAAMGVVERARSQPVPSADLARAKAMLLTREFMGKQSNSQRAQDAALNVLYGEGLDRSQRYLKAVQSLDAKVIQAAAKRHLRNPTAAVITVQPVEEKVLLEALKLKQ